MEVKKKDLIEGGFDWLGFGEREQGSHSTSKSDLVSLSLKDKIED